MHCRAKARLRLVQLSCQSPGKAHRAGGAFVFRPNFGGNADDKLNGRKSLLHPLFYQRGKRLIWQAAGEGKPPGIDQKAVERIVRRGGWVGHGR
jgi:hypothetical protein